MKERPILFNAPMVRALLDGSKTQTRRALLDGSKTQTRRVCKLEVRAGMPDPEWRSLLRCCPYGQPGDRLWVRETFVQGYPYDATTDRLLQCDADGNDLPMTTWYRANGEDFGWSDDDGWQANVPWKPSIHMPRTASRITLEITGVRVERLRDINADDAMAEGIQRLGDGGYASDNAGRNYHASSAWYAYASLWESINGPGSWDTNPLVWVIEFKQVQGTKA
jgi:hypothetical protein